MKVVGWVGMAILGIMVSGCATIIHGTTQEVAITSVPDGADVRVGDFKGTTPTKVELSRKTSHIAQISKQGFKTETVKLERVVSGAVAGNILAGGLIGWGIDAASGGQYRLVPENIHVVLQPERPEFAPRVNLEEELKKLEDLKAQGKITEEEYATLRKRLIETYR